MISIIAAMTKTHKIIGKDNKLPWNIPADLKNFKLLTNNSVVIMCRKTYESIPKKFRPLPNRVNIILSRSWNQADTNEAILGDERAKSRELCSKLEIANSPEEAIQLAKTHEKDIFIIGGAQIYKLLEQYADTMHISFIKHEYEGNTKFPEINWNAWKEESTQDKGEFELTIFKKKDTIITNQ